MGKTIMVMGTASGVGKSTVVLALCRLLTKMGYRVAPFKAQNITDHIHVLPDGKKMSTSSALAAVACHLAPQTDMGPVLLTPAQQGGVKLIVNGEEIEKEKEVSNDHLFDQAFSAYERLLKAYDLVVVEGAGSPVELNLMAQDIVNMNFATRAHVPVLLVSEIHRGGVFASVYGTLGLLSEEQRTLIKGVMINKFMGEPSLFKDGEKLMAEITGLPQLGTLPFMPIKIEDEDRLSEGELKTKASLYLEKEEDYIAAVDAAIEELATQVEKYLDLAMITEIINKGA